MTFTVRFTRKAELDLERVYSYIIEREGGDLTQADEVIDAIKAAIGRLRIRPFACRQADRKHPSLRELIIPFGRSGYVALFDLDTNQNVTIVAIRHQREVGFF